MVYLGSVPINDPQDGRAPLSLVPTTSVGQLLLNGVSYRCLPGASNIEGVIQVLEPSQLSRDPIADIELSKGDRDLKQRRARFSSPATRVGIDFAYDELRNNGYSFDARGIVNGSGYGSSATRVQSADLRGTVGDNDRYRFSFRKFETSFQGDTLFADSSNRRDGFIALVESSVDGLQASLFGRGHNVATRDSVTENQTVGISVAASVLGKENHGLFVGLAYENVFCRQHVGGSRVNERLQTASANAGGRVRFGRGTIVDGRVDASHQFDLAFGWGARVAVAQELGSMTHLWLEARRAYRLPNLGELFLPAHMTTLTTTVAGNRDVAGEASLEGVAKLFSRFGRVENELRMTAIRVRDPILPRVDSGAPTTTVRPSNAEAQSLRVLLDRVRIKGTLLGLDFNLAAGASYALGDRDRYFEGVPELRANASASVGRSLFRNTSELFLTGEFEYAGSRVTHGAELPSFRVFNLKLEGRLVDAYLFLLWSNVLDERYQTVAPYLMTPRTFVYGIAWKFYN